MSWGSILTYFRRMSRKSRKCQTKLFDFASPQTLDSALIMVEKWTPVGIV